MALTTSAAIIRDARAVSGPAMGILEIGRDAFERTSAVLPRNRLILLHFKYITVHTRMHVQTKYECQFAAVMHLSL